MTRDEWRAGLVRLAVLCVGLAAFTGLLALPFALGGATASGALAAACGLVGMLLLLGGVVAHWRGGFRARRTLRRTDELDLAQGERRDHDRLALGLLALGMLFAAVAISLG